MILTGGPQAGTATNALTRVNAGAPGGIRTPNLLIRSQMLYPLSHGCWAAGKLAGRLRRVSLARFPPTFPSTSGHAPFPPVHQGSVLTSSRVVIVVVVALIFDFTNGFYDSANAMAGPIANRCARAAYGRHPCGAAQARRCVPVDRVFLTA